MNKDLSKKTDYIQQNINAESNNNDALMSTWANNKNDRMISPVVLYRYQKILSKINILLLGVQLILLSIVFFLIIRFLFFHPQEMLIFDDGTDITCLYNPSSGEMKQNDK